MMPHSTTISFQEWLKDHNGDISQLLFDWNWSLSASQYTRVPAPTYATTVAEAESTSFSAPLATDADEAQVNEQTCTYDYMGRRATKKVEEITTDAERNETTAIISNHRFIYRGYLQIGCCDLTRSGHPSLWLITWDPTQPIATRPLAIKKDGTWYTYGWDLTKNICKVFGQNGYIRSTYIYTPFGSVTASGDVTQPIQWSSEYFDNELALVYYNYRHYNPTDGRWINRDPIAEQGGWNLYSYISNIVLFKIDLYGLEEDILGEKEDETELYTIEYEGEVLLEVGGTNSSTREVQNWASSAILRRIGILKDLSEALTIGTSELSKNLTTAKDIIGLQLSVKIEVFCECKELRYFYCPDESWEDELYIKPIDFNIRSKSGIGGEYFNHNAPFPKNLDKVRNKIIQKYKILVDRAKNKCSRFCKEIN